MYKKELWDHDTMHSKDSMLDFCKETSEPLWKEL